MNSIRETDEPNPDLMTVERKLCADCGELFSLTRREVLWFEARHMHVPRRCEPCRRARRLADGHGQAQLWPVDGPARMTSKVRS